MKKALLLVIMMMVCFSLSNLSAEVPAPVAYWNFDETSGSTVFDAYPPNIPGTLMNGTSRVPGISGNCLRFLNNQYVNMGNVNSSKLDIYGQNPISVSAWVRPFRFRSEDQQILSKGYNGSITQYELKKTSPDGKVSFRCYNVGEVQSNVPLQLNVWTHIVGVFEPTGGTQGKWRIYFSGVDVSNLGSPYKSGQPVHTNNDFHIGAVQSGSTPVQFWWDGLIDEAKVWNVALNAVQVSELYNGFTGQSGNLSNIALWLDPNDLDADGFTNDNPADGTLISEWNDKTLCMENATMFIQNRKPKYSTYTNGINGFFPCLKFTTDYAPTKYGYSDIMEILSTQTQSCGETENYFTELTSNVENKWTPESIDKSLLVVFQTGNDPAQENPAYYADGRQTIAEFGGPLSGYNIYLNQGKIIFGMWNRFESKYIMLDELDALFPMGTEATYLAHLEYFSEDPYAKNFRGVLTRYIPNSGSVPPYHIDQWVSPWMKFSGLTKDENDNSSIGGAARTRYHDYSVGSTYSDHFGGKIGDVMVVNNSSVSGDDLYNYLKTKYLVNDLEYPQPSVTPAPRQGNWIAFENDLTNVIEVRNLVATPNPFTNETNISLIVEQNDNYKFEVLDMTGRLVFTAFEGNLGQGIQNISISNNMLSNGAYLLKVANSSSVSSIIIFVNK